MEDSFISSRYGKLIVVKRVDDYIAPSGGKHKKYLCLCDCGKETTVLKEHLVSGRQKSCGCLKKNNGVKKHGDTNTRLYRVWSNMCNRCSNKNNPAWSNYGGRGITVCDEWHEYLNFKSWAIKNGYKDTLTIDRIDNDSGYSPDNCRWANNYTQANNKRDNNVVTYNGVSKTIAEWATYYGIRYKTLHRRIVSLGWDVGKALNTPVRKSKNS